MTALVENPGITLAALPLLVLALAPSLAMALRWAPRDWIWPPFFFSMILFLGYLFPLPGFLAGRDLFSLEWGYLYRDFEESLRLALMLVTGGAAAFYAGYVLSSIGPCPRPRYQSVWSVARLRLAGLLCTTFALGMLGMGVVLLGGPQALTASLVDRTRAFAGMNYFVQSSLLLPIFALVWFAYLLAEGRLWCPWLALYAVGAVGIAGFAGQKANIFIIIVATGVALHVLYRRISLRLLPILLVLGLCLLAAYDFYFREYLPLGGFGGDNPYITFGERFGYMLERVLAGNFIQLQQLTAMVDVVPDVLPWQYGRSYLTLLIAPVPSSIWPEKPMLSAYDYTVTLWPYRWSGEGTSMPPSLMGEMYLNFGPVFVVIGMCVFGYCYGLAYRWMRARSDRPFAVVGYGILLGLMVHYIRGEFTAATILLLLAMTPLTVLRYFVMRDAGAPHWATVRPKATLQVDHRSPFGRGTRRPL